MTDAQNTIQSFWETTEARDWDRFRPLIAENVVYHLPQTGERVRGRDRFVRLFAEYPGDWHLTVERITGAGRHAASWIRMELDGDTQPGISFFDLDEDGRVAHITDFWPEPYQPPSGREHLVE